ncbi:MAG: hypothetical protein Q9216_001806 [Gyalolechia sp. 2 TL-2023]
MAPATPPATSKELTIATGASTVITVVVGMFVAVFMAYWKHQEERRRWVRDMKKDEQESNEEEYRALKMKKMRVEIRLAEVKTAIALHQLARLEKEHEDEGPENGTHIPTIVPKTGRHIAEVDDNMRRRRSTATQDSDDFHDAPSIFQASEKSMARSL